MANHTSALKRARQSVKKRARNRAALSLMKTTLKKFRATLASKKADSIATELKKTTMTLARAASKGIIPKKRASRKISRLTKNANKSVGASAS